MVINDQYFTQRQMLSILRRLSMKILVEVWFCQQRGGTVEIEIKEELIRFRRKDYANNSIGSDWERGPPRPP